MAGDAVELVRLRNEFYRDNYRRLCTAVFIAFVAIISLIGMLFYVMDKKPQPKYFATSDDGRILPLVPLNQPYRTEAQILQFAAEAAIASYTYDYVNYRQQLQGAAEYFTTDGWTRYMAALQRSGNLEAVKSDKVIAVAKPTGAAQIQQEGLLRNRYAWQVAIPVQVTFQGQSLAQTVNYNIIMRIIRLSTLEKATGIGVQQIVVESSEKADETPRRAG